MADETPTVSPLSMDRGLPLGNSPSLDGIRRLHTKISNDASEPVPVTGNLTATVNTTGLATSTNQTSEISLLTDIKANQTNGTQHVVVDSLPAGGSGDGAILDGVTPTIRATVTAANALKVDASAVTQPISGAVSVSNFPASQPVTGTFWQATQPISGTVTANAGTNLNTSSLALESGGHLSSLDTKTPALGSALTSASTPVNIASDQTVPISASSLPLASGAATASNQTTANTSLSSIDTKSTRAFSTATNSRPTVTTTSATILAANANRKYAYISNQSGSVVFIKFTDAAVSGQGIRLSNNSIFEIDNDSLFTGAVTAIVATGTAILDICEGT